MCRPRDQILFTLRAGPFFISIQLCRNRIKHLLSTRSRCCLDTISNPDRMEWDRNQIRTISFNNFKIIPSDMKQAKKMVQRAVMNSSLARKTGLTSPNTILAEPTFLPEFNKKALRAGRFLFCKRSFQNTEFSRHKLLIRKKQIPLT